MKAQGEALVTAIHQNPPDLEATFVAHYARISRVLARVVRDRARAEELAVEVFLKWARHPAAHGEQSQGWLFRTAVRLGLDELRREARRARTERLLATDTSTPATPEDVRAAREERERVRVVLAALRGRDAELLVLRSHGFSYDELAPMLRVKPSSVGTLLSRAQEAFRQEYVRRYEHE